MDLKTTIERDGKKNRVSTVRLSSFYDGNPYETMVFSADDDGHTDDWIDLYCNRYKTKTEAKAGHDKTVETFHPG